MVQIDTSSGIVSSIWLKARLSAGTRALTLASPFGVLILKIESKVLWTYALSTLTLVQVVAAVRLEQIAGAGPNEFMYIRSLFSAAAPRV